MADFAAVLKRTLEKMGDTSPEIRAKVYEKARDTVRRQIDAMENTPPQAAIDRQFAKLEDAISSVEGEFAPLEDDLGLDELFADDEPTPEVEQPAPEPEPEAEPEPEPEPVVEAEPEADIEPEPEPIAEEVVVEAAPEVKTSSRVDELRARAKKNMALMETEAAAEAAAVEDIVASGEVSASVDDAAASLDTAIDDLKAASSGSVDDALDSMIPEAPVSDIDIINDPLGDIGAAAGAATAKVATPKSGGGFGRSLKWLVVLGVLGGGAYYGSQNQTEIKSWWSGTAMPWWQEITSGLGTSDDQSAASETSENGVPVRTVTTTPVDNVEEPEAATEAPAASQVENINAAEPTTKFTQRLTEDGTEVDEGPAVAEGTPPTAGEGSSVAEQTAGTEAPIEPETEGAEEPAVETAEATPPVAVTPVGQRSIFYEERTGSQEGTAISGATVWTVVNESPGGDLPVEPAIRAQTNVPELGLEMEMTIRRNGDGTFPASHVIELFFRVPESFEGRGIADVQRITFKSSEQEPGNALIAVPAPLDENIFLIALTDAATAVDTNVNLMRREGWIDIPLQYISGRRALVTFEKGVTGERVFEEVFAAWDAAPIN